MDFLNKAFAQFNDLFRSMSPGSRITAGLLLVVAVVSVGYLFQSQVTGGDEYLFGGADIPTPTLHRMEEVLGKGGQNCTIEGTRIKVRRADRIACLAALADAGALPPNPGDYLKESTISNLIDDPQTRNRKQSLAVMEELSLAISLMKNIERASVLIDSQAQPGLGQAPIKTASVSVAAIGGAPLDDEQVDKICNFVAGAIAGMKPENVTIADANGPVRHGSRSEGGLDGDPYARAVRKAEQELNSKIRDSLSYIQKLTVTSTVVLDHEKGSRTIENKLDPKPVPVRTKEDTRSMTRGTDTPGGAPGLGSQGGGVNQPVRSLASAGGNETNEEAKNEQVNEVARTSTEKETYGLTPKSAKVSIGIPASYYDKVWLERNPPKAGDEAKKPDQTALDEIRKEITKDVTAHVATLLPPSEVKDPTTLVTVTTFQDIKPTEITGPGIPQRTFIWLTENWPMLAMIVLVLISVGMLRSVLRAAPAAASTESAAISSRFPASESKTEEKEEPVEAAAARRLRRLTGSGPSLRDELSELVKEDPDSAASILRTWIGQVN